MTSFYRPSIAALPEMDLVARQVYAMSGPRPDGHRRRGDLRRLHADRAVAARGVRLLQARARPAISCTTATSSSAVGCRSTRTAASSREAYIHGMNGVNEGVRLIRGTSVQPAQEERSRAGDRRRRRADERA